VGYCEAWRIQPVFSCPNSKLQGGLGHTSPSIGLPRLHGLNHLFPNFTPSPTQPTHSFTLPPQVGICQLRLGGEQLLNDDLWWQEGREHRGWVLHIMVSRPPHCLRGMAMQADRQGGREAGRQADMLKLAPSFV